MSVEGVQLGTGTDGPPGLVEVKAGKELTKVAVAILVLLVRL